MAVFSKIAIFTQGCGGARKNRFELRYCAAQATYQRPGGRPQPDLQGQFPFCQVQLCQGSGTATLDSVADSKFHMIPYEELISGPVCNFIKADGQTARANGRFIRLAICKQGCGGRSLRFSFGGPIRYCAAQAIHQRPDNHPQPDLQGQFPFYQKKCNCVKQVEPQP